MGVVCPCIRAMKSREVKAVARREQRQCAFRISRCGNVPKIVVVEAKVARIQSWTVGRESSRLSLGGWPFCQFTRITSWRLLDLMFELTSLRAPEKRRMRGGSHKGETL